MGFRLNRCTNNSHKQHPYNFVNKVVAAAFLDIIIDAFDNVFSEAVLSETQKIGVPARLRRIYSKKTLSLIEVYT